MSKNKGGRPVKFKNLEELNLAIDNYFKDCDEKEKPYTVNGLALALNCDMSTLREYRDCMNSDDVLKSLDIKAKQEFSLSIKRAYQKCELFVEEKLLDPKCSKSPIGYIFALKNFGWVDKQEIEQTNKDITVELTD